MLIPVLGYTVSTIAGVMMTLLIVRAVLSWFMPSYSGKFVGFIYYVTDIVLFPVRYAMDKLGIENNLPIDISFFITYILLSFVRSVF